MYFASVSNSLHFSRMCVCVSLSWVLQNQQDLSTCFDE